MNHDGSHLSVAVRVLHCAGSTEMPAPGKEIREPKVRGQQLLLRLLCLMLLFFRKGASPVSNTQHSPYKDLLKCSNGPWRAGAGVQRAKILFRFNLLSHPKQKARSPFVLVNVYSCQESRGWLAEHSREPISRQIS